MTIVDENYLDERLGQLENVAGWSPRTLSRFETFILTSEDYLLFKINPLEYARDKNIKEKEACDLFLQASRLGLFDIQWGLVCPMCGDTVMATFLTPLDGVNAALHMLREIDDFNDLRGSPDLVLKIGLHHGAAIAVTLNDRLDYFGQTVNIAARVQGLADEDEIYITKEVFDAEGVKEALVDFEVLAEQSAEQSKLKGISEAVSVYKVRV